MKNDVVKVSKRAVVTMHPAQGGGLEVVAVVHTMHPVDGGRPYLLTQQPLGAEPWPLASLAQCLELRDPLQTRGILWAMLDTDEDLPTDSPVEFVDVGGAVLWSMKPMAGVEV